MVQTILQTKLYPPPPRPDLVLRPHLITQLDEGAQRKLILISAPAGFGKTTLVGRWLAGTDGAARGVAWLSLDKGEGDAVRFLSYVVAALQTLDIEVDGAQIGAGALSLLLSPQPPPTETILTALLNEIDHACPEFFLVLDDYHVVEEKEIDEILAFLIDHLPPQMHLLITTREDPNLPLARYRVRGEMIELRADALRFSSAEAAEFLNHRMGLSLAADEVGELETRTEGWIAGLQMAALSLQGHNDRAHFIQDFTGSHRFVLDYLAEEVLHHQPEAVRSFLLKTAILSRLSGPLCNAITGRDDGKQMLEQLERGNLFLIPLDDRRQWYRYHHLFAEVLLAHAMDVQPNDVCMLHRRASEWYEAHGFRNDAIHHAFAAQDLTLAANLVELTWPALHRSKFRSAELLAWLEAIPDELIRDRPVLGVGYAWELLNGGEFGAAEERLQDAERWINAPDMVQPLDVSEGEMLYMDEEELRLLPTEIASARAYLAMARGDVFSTVMYAQRALNLIPTDDHIRRGPAASLLGLAYWTIGELEAGYKALAEGMSSFQRAGNILFGISGTFGMAEIKITQGRLREAIETYEQALLLAAKHGGRAFQGSADLHLGLSELHRQRGELAAAEEHRRKSDELSEQATQQVYHYHLALAEARTRQDQGDIDGALRSLDEAEELFAHVHIPDFRPVPAMKVRVRLAQGQVDDALRWVKEREIGVEDDLSYLREFEHITLARVLIAHYKKTQSVDVIHQAMTLLKRLLQAAESGGRIGSVIEILLLQALAHDVQGDSSMALVPLARALTLAEPEGYVQLFVDEGQPLQSLLRAMLSSSAMRAYAAHLLKAMSSTRDDEPVAPDPNQLLIDPLSDRELEVLHLLAIGHTNQAIADELVIAISTVKKHVNNIFGKLNVASRTQAVNYARELGIL